MFFSDYEDYTDVKLNPKLLWEYDLTTFDYQDMRNVVVQRVIERGWPSDYYAMLNLYGEDGVIEAVKVVPYFNDMDMNFVHVLFNIPLTELKSYHKKKLPDRHWDS